MMLAFLTALAEPTRLAAVLLLHDRGEPCVCDLTRSLDATQSRQSRHMQVLKQAGPVVNRRDAPWVRYGIRPKLPTHLHALLAAVLFDTVMA